jgi:hypothetical protein
MAERHQTLLDTLRGGDEHGAQAALRSHFMAAARGNTIALDERQLTLLGWNQAPISAE